MSVVKDAPTAYAASCNPPRRAKRYRTGSLVDHDGPSVSSTQSSLDKSAQRPVARPPILPKQPARKDYHLPPSPESDSASEEEDEYEPGRDPAPAPKRRGRKPGTMSRSARESLRKLNHSKIEKARRTKINETLATLSSLVNDRNRILPSASGETPPASAEKEEEAKGKKGKKAEEKEFKLDVLVKTVEFMQDLIARVSALESAMCAQCRLADRPNTHANSQSSREPLKRKRVDVEEKLPPARQKRHRNHPDDDDCYGGDDEHGLANSVEEEQTSPLPFIHKPSSTTPGAPSTSSPRLPPIASWLPHPYMDPSSLMSVSPSMGPTRSPTNVQLPSPPSSGRFRPATTLSTMPALSLPGPAQPLTLSLGAAQRTSAPPPPRLRGKSVSASPSASPTWTPEDETAASLLLEMSSKPSSKRPPSLVGPLGLPTPREEVGRDRAMPRTFEVATPSSLLGMRD